MPALEARGVELAWTERGQGRLVVLIHESGADGTVWQQLSEELSKGARAIAYDRRGWGASTAPDGYLRTTVEEHSEDAAALISSLDSGPAVVCGAGVGAVIALDLMLRLDQLVSGSVLIEPPLLQLVPAGTEALSEDRRRMEIAAGTGESVIDLYLSGGLPALGPGVTGIPQEVTAGAREHPASVIAELGMASTWRTPLPALAAANRPSVIVTSPSTPPLLGEVAVALEARLGQSSGRHLDSGSLAPHVGAATELAALVRELPSPDSG